MRRARCDCVDSAVGSELLEHFDHRPERDSFAVVEAAATHNRGVEAVEQLRNEPRLADAGRAEQREKVT